MPIDVTFCRLEDLILDVWKQLRFTAYKRSTSIPGHSAKQSELLPACRAVFTAGASEIATKL